VLAIDLSVHMLDLAKGNIEVAGFRERILLDRGDGKQLPYADERFRAVVSNTIVHHLADPRPALSEAQRVLVPGGLILVRDLLRPATDDDVRRLVQCHAAEATPHQRQLFDDSLRAALTLEE